MKYIKIMADYSSDGVWDEHGVMLDVDELGLPDDLFDRHYRWRQWFETALDNDDWGCEGFAEEGRKIAIEFKKFFGPDVTIVYFDEFRLENLIEQDQPREDRRVFEYEITQDMVDGNVSVKSFFEEQRYEID
jgi:hypothetical protein